MGFSSRRPALAIAAAVGLVLSAAACGTDDSGGKSTADCGAYEQYEGQRRQEGLDLLVHPGRSRPTGCEQSWKQFEDCTGIEIDHEGSGEFEAQLQVRVDGGNAPDIAFIPQPGLLKRFADAGKLKPVSAPTPRRWPRQNYTADWLKYGTVNGTALRRAARLQREVLRLVLAEDVQGEGLAGPDDAGTS